MKALRFLIPGEIRVFPTVQTPEARAWIAARYPAKKGLETPAAIRKRPVRGRGRSEGLRLDARASLTPIVGRRAKRSAGDTDGVDPPVLLVMPSSRRRKADDPVGTARSRHYPLAGVA